MREKMMRAGVKADQRKPFGELFFDGDFDTPLTEENAGSLAKPLEMVRLAPSAVNSQPWYFVHDGHIIHTYCKRKGNRLDVGIALAHLYVANEKSFHFCKTENPPAVPEFDYVGSVTLERKTL